MSEGQSKQRKSTELVKRRNQVSSFYFGTDDAVNKTEEESYVVHHRPEARIEVVTRETEVSERGDQKEDEEVDKGRPKSPEARIEKTAYVEVSNLISNISTFSHLFLRFIQTVVRCLHQLKVNLVKT